jgi:hypothetical protein
MCPLTPAELQHTLEKRLHRLGCDRGAGLALQTQRNNRHEPLQKEWSELSASSTSLTKCSRFVPVPNLLKVSDCEQSDHGSQS